MSAYAEYEDPEKKGLDVSHFEDSKIDNEVVVDSQAKGYTDHTIVIDDETNRRLRKLINWRYVLHVLTGPPDPVGCCRACVHATSLKVSTRELSVLPVSWVSKQTPVCTDKTTPWPYVSFSNNRSS